MDSDRKNHRPLGTSTAAACVALVAALSACSGAERGTTTAPRQPVPGAITTLAGDHQRGTVGQSLASSLVVRVTDPLGRPLPGVDVAWGELVGGGFTMPDVSPTDDSGRAAVVWTVGTVAELNTAIARVPGLPADTFVAAALPGPPTQVSRRTQPATSFVGSPIAPALQVQLRDAQRNPATGSVDTVTITLTPGTGTPGAVLSGTLAAVSSAALATFSDLQLDRTGTGYTLTISSACCASVTTNPFDMLPDPIVRVAFNVSPIPVWTAGAVAPIVQAALENLYGNVVMVGAGDLSVSLTPGTGTPGARLSGTLTRTVIGGIATFTDLSVDRAGSGYTLTVTSTARGLTGVSVPFDVR